jgi:transposase
MKTIFALDLGKFKTVSCLLTEDHASIPVFKTIMTNPKTFEQFLLDVKPSLLVLEVCGLSGWVVDLARKLGVEVLVAHPGGEAWQWGKVKRKTLSVQRPSRFFGAVGLASWAKRGHPL